MAQPIDIKKEESHGASGDLPRDNSPRQADSRGTREAVAARLKQARLSMKLTQKAAAIKADGMSLPSYKDYEAGKSMPGSKAVQKLTKLGINANWLLSGEGLMLLSELPAAAPARQPVLITEEDYIDLIPPKIGGAAAKCPGCGTFVGFIKIDGRVQLEFDSPGGMTLLKIMAALQPVFKGDSESLYDLSLRAYAVLSLLTAGSEDSINNLLSKPNLVSTLAAFCEELNASPPHSHAPPEAKT